MKVMQSVAQEDWTMWTSVYNLSAREHRLAYRQHYGGLHQERLESVD
jgi:hypothetical protein